jgi:flagellar hook assembly protein FlgD
MNKYVSIFSIIIIIYLCTFLISEPSFNGNNPGCSGGGCHSFKSGEISVTTNELEVEVSLPNISSGEKVAGELVNNQGSVVSVINSTTNNPFILTAPSTGSYVVNAGYKKPSREWDSLSVQITLSDINNRSAAVLPQSMELYDNHPNPFNNETLIRFSLPDQAYIALQIFNLNGQLVRDLVNNNLPGGVHSVRWNGKDNSGHVVASGVYLYQLQSSDRKIAKRLMLIK